MTIFVHHSSLALVLPNLKLGFFSVLVSRFKTVVTSFFVTVLQGRIRCRRPEKTVVNITSLSILQ